MACEYCEDSKHIFTGTVDEDPIVYIEDAEIVLDYDGVFETVDANYCFHCGEKLGDTNE